MTAVPPGVLHPMGVGPGGVASPPDVVGYPWREAVRRVREAGWVVSCRRVRFGTVGQPSAGVACPGPPRVIAQRNTPQGVELVLALVRQLPRSADVERFRGGQDPQGNG